MNTKKKVGLRPPRAGRVRGEPTMTGPARHSTAQHGPSTGPAQAQHDGFTLYYTREYEALTLDCPLFTRARLVLDQSEASN